ncbi:MAG: radical SAM protein [Myxococcales bacterium]|nr:radical SAM protein [Myxococcales bacterium]
MTDRLAQRFERVLAAMARTSDPLGDPLALDFEPCTGEWHAEQWQRFAERAATPGLVLYLHLPYCAKICSYCLLSAERPAGAGAIERYVEAMVRELDRHGELLAGLPVTRLHVGGGTPTLLGAPALGRILGAARARFGPSPGAAEAHPSTTTREKLEVMVAHGIERVSFGVESLTPEVLARVARADQTLARVGSAVRTAHELGMRVNVDLLAGLPGETVESFEHSLRTTLELPIDALSVNRFLVDGSPLGRSGLSLSPDDVRAASEMLARTDAIVRSVRPPDFPPAAPADVRFGVQYQWQRPLLEPGYSQQDMIDPGSVLAVGAGGMGKIASGYHYVARGSAARWAETVLAGALPEQMVCRTDARFEQAFRVADLVCRGALDESPVARAFRAELDFLESTGVLVGSRLPPGSAIGAAHLIAFLSGRTGSPRDEPAVPEYDLIGGPLPPSLLWCRLAMRAAAAARSGP